MAPKGLDSDLFSAMGWVRVSVSPLDWATERALDLEMAERAHSRRPRRPKPAPEAARLRTYPPQCQCHTARGKSRKRSRKRQRQP